MLKLAQVPRRRRTSEPHFADASQPSARDHRYFAFLSYSHKDRAIADWLHRALERFRVPASLTAQSSINQVVPGTLRPIFRDRLELAAADDLSTEIREALLASQYLIVLCSPAAAQSKWTNAEIDVFKRSRANGRVLAAIGAGEPFASENPGRENEECFPPALRQKYDRKGRPTSGRAEPIAADLRESGDGKQIGFLKLVAGMLGVGLDELVQREARRKRRRLILLTASSIAAAGIMTALGVGVLDSRIAAAHARDAADDQRLKALSLQANEALRSGDASSAERLFKQALAMTAEAMRRNPNDPRRIFDHAQNVFYVGDLALQRGDQRTAEEYMVEYSRLSRRLIELQPQNLKWRTEVQYADSNLGIMLFEKGRFDQAAERLSSALQQAKVLANAAPYDRSRKEQVAEMMAWLADARFNQGHLAEAVSLREQDLAVLNSLSLREASDLDYQMRLTNAHVAAGRYYAATGQSRRALDQFRAAVATTEQSIPIDDASQWYRTTINARLALAAFTLEAGGLTEAAIQAQSACSLVDRLNRQTNGDPSWQTDARHCWLVRGRLALAAGRHSEAVSDAQHAVGLAKASANSENSPDRIERARAYRLLGDTQIEVGNKAVAQQAWSAALASLSGHLVYTPSEMDERAQILQRLGRSGEAAELDSKLKAIGYHITSS